MLSKILNFFYDISSIPHPTYKEEKLANYVFNVAKNLNLECKKDKFNNVYIKKTVDKNKPYTVLHSHLDMVCVKDPNYNINFETDGLKLINKNNYLTAYKTSLGADNGIGVAIILALLTNENHNMEVIFTTDEECTTTGATNFDYSQVTGKNLISLDGFKLNEVIIGCASVCDMKINLNCKYSSCNEKGFNLSISGLKGGHSGGDIAKKIGNSIKIATEILKHFKDIKLSKFNAGEQFNFIPNEAQIDFTTSNITNFDNIVKQIKETYPSVKIKLKPKQIKNCLDIKQSKNIISLLDSLPSGVINKKSKIIQLSQNISAIDLDKSIIKINQRGTNLSLENKNIENISFLCKKFNFDFSIYDKLCGFETNRKSQLVNTLCNLSLKTNNIKLKKVVKHISLECSIFQEKLPDSNIVAISPKIDYAHSTSERVYLPSITQCYNLVKNYLETV